jgi:hypothetical protein
MRIAPLLLCLLASTAARAQAPQASDAPLDKSSRLVLEPGKPVRIMREDVRLEGLVLETNGRFLTLDTGAIESEQILLSNVAELSVRKRAVVPGTLIGAGAGFVGGALLGLYGCGIIEYSSTGDCLAFAGLGGSAIGLMGAGVGAVVGLLIPRWVSVYDRGRDGQLILAERQAPEELMEDLQVEGEVLPLRRHFAQLGLMASGVLMIKEPIDAIAPGARVQALLRLGTHVAVGPDVAFHYLSRGLDGFFLHDPMFSLGVLMRATPRPSVLTPAALVGFSIHTVGQPVTYSVGVGADWAAPEGPPLTFELRWHQFNVPWKDGRQLTLGLGTRLFW